MMFREPYVVNLDECPGSITVKVPTIGEIIQLGENRFYQTLNIFIANTTQYRVVLWEMGIDWNVWTDFQLFVMLKDQIDSECASILFENVDFSKFQPMMVQKPDKGNEELILWNEEDEIEINYDVWNHFHQYIQAEFNMCPEEKITKSDYLKKWYIDKDKREIERRQKALKAGKVESKSSMMTVISACINHPGFKYKLDELKNVGVCEFYDSVQRLQIYEQSTALMKGIMGGFVSGKDIKPEQYNFMRDING